MSALPLVLVIGAAGATGLPIVNALAKNGSTRVAALVRPSSLSDPSYGPRLAHFRSLDVEIRSGSLRDTEDEIRGWMNGADVVISCVIYSELLAQRRVVKVAKEIGVKRFVPSDFAGYCPGGGIMALQEKKELVHKCIIESELGYTFIDTGTWSVFFGVQAIFTALKRYGDHNVVDVVRRQKVPVMGSGEKRNAVTHLPDVGELVSRIVLDPRTINKRVFCMGDAVTMNQMGNWYEEDVGVKLTWKQLDEDLLHRGIAEYRAIMGPIEGDPPIPLPLLGAEYNLSRWVRGDNMPPMDSLKSWELYPDYVCKKWRDWLQEIMAPTKAVLIGINYRGSAQELRGCINDVTNVSKYLSSVAGYNPANMVILTDDHGAQDAKFMPTNKNIRASFQWLLRDARAGDHLFLHYSGHGSQEIDTDGRASGKDDTIVPIDYQTNGQIGSDDLHRMLVTPLPNGVRLTVLMDCCHSGSILQLPFHFRTDGDGNVVKFDFAKKALASISNVQTLLGKDLPVTHKIAAAKDLFNNVKDIWTHLKQPEGQNQQQQTGQGPRLEEQDYGHPEWNTENKEVFCFSGCMDEQTSADATIQGTASGAMSWALLTTLQQQPRQSYASLLTNTRQLLAQKYSQVPQLSVGRDNENLEAPFDP
ncbi:hypothetical protein HDU93_006088 [Gonapodya sp. JEL0774]|nr:hypothetical protein HDU93_006088 [Gonapodya sp. JEL0774]